jgi:hypothetical protein
MGTDKVTYAVVERCGGATGSRTNRKSRKWSRAHAQPEFGVPALFSGVLTGNDVFHYFSPFFFNLFLLFLIFFHTTFSTSNNTWMRNRKLRNIHPSGAF